MGVQNQRKPGKYCRVDPQHPLSFKLSHFWLLNEGEGTVLRNVAWTTGNSAGILSARDSDIILGDGTTQLWGKEPFSGVDNCLQCIGTAGAIKGTPRTAMPNLLTAWTIQMRLCPQAVVTSNAAIISTGSTPIIAVKGSASADGNDVGKMNFRYSSTDHMSTSLMNVAAGNTIWYDWILTHDQAGNVGTWYLNSVADNTYAAGGLGTLTFDSFFNNASSFDYIGYVDFIRIWKGRVLTPQEVYEAYRDPMGCLIEPKTKYKIITLLALSKPTVTGISPRQSNGRGRTVPVTITGTNFVGTPTVNAGPGITFSAVIVVNSTTITVSLIIEQSATLGSHSVTVTTAGGTSDPYTIEVTDEMHTCQRRLSGGGAAATGTKDFRTTEV